MGPIELPRVIQGYWRLTSWDWSPEKLADDMNACVENGVPPLIRRGPCAAAESVSGGSRGKRWPSIPRWRSRIELVTKVGIVPKGENAAFSHYNTTYDHVMRACRDCLERLGTDYVDLLLIHREDPCLDPAECGRALKDLQAEGLIRAYGVSNFNTGSSRRLIRRPDRAWSQIRSSWSPLFTLSTSNSGMMDLLTGTGIHPIDMVASGRRKIVYRQR